MPIHIYLGLPKNIFLAKPLVRGRLFDCRLRGCRIKSNRVHRLGLLNEYFSNATRLIWTFHGTALELNPEYCSGQSEVSSVTTRLQSRDNKACFYCRSLSTSINKVGGVETTPSFFTVQPHIFQHQK